MIDILHVCLFISVAILILGYNAACMRASGNEKAAKRAIEALKDIIELDPQGDKLQTHVAMKGILFTRIYMVPGDSDDKKIK